MNAAPSCSAPADEQAPDGLARDRTALANERTYAAWVRTGLASLIAALGIAKFIDSAVPVWTVRTLAAVMIALSITAFVLAAWRYMGLCLKLKTLDIALIPHHVVIVISAFLVLCSLLAFYAVWMMT